MERAQKLLWDQIEYERQHYTPEDNLSELNEIHYKITVYLSQH